MDIINIALTRDQLNFVETDGVLELPIPPVENPKGRSVATVFIRLHKPDGHEGGRLESKPEDLKCLTGAPHVAHTWGHTNQYNCPGVDVDDDMPTFLVDNDGVNPPTIEER